MKNLKFREKLKNQKQKSIKKSKKKKKQRRENCFYIKLKWSYLKSFDYYLLD